MPCTVVHLTIAHTLISAHKGRLLISSLSSYNFLRNMNFYMWLKNSMDPDQLASDQLASSEAS